MRQRILAGIVLSLLAAASNAALLGRAPLTPGGIDYQAYYDTVLNITWSADGMLSRTTGYDADGLLNWDEGQTWITSLNGGAYLGASDWRMPNMDVNGDTVVLRCYVSGVTEAACRDNEFGYLAYYDHVGESFFGCSTCGAPFVNVFNGYWSGTNYAADPTRAWAFSMNLGEVINPATKCDTCRGAIWAVRPGDIGVVPVPAAAWLLASALGALGWASRRTQTETSR